MIQVLLGKLFLKWRRLENCKLPYSIKYLMTAYDVQSIVLSIVIKI